MFRNKLTLCIPNEYTHMNQDMEPHSGFQTQFVQEQDHGSIAQDDQLRSDAWSAARTPSPGKTWQGRGVRTISSNDAIVIFNAAKHDRTKRDRLANRFAKEFGITPKAVRDIWNLRTWVQTTKPLWSPHDETHFLKRDHRKNTKRMSMKQSATQPAPPQEKDIPTSVPPTAIRNVCPQSSATTTVHSDLKNSSRFFEGEWMICPSFIAQDFESIFLEWSNMNPTLTLGYDDFVIDNASARSAGL